MKRSTTFAISILTLGLSACTGPAGPTGATVENNACPYSDSYAGYTYANADAVFANAYANAISSNGYSYTDAD